MGEEGWFIWRRIGIAEMIGGMRRMSRRKVLVTWMRYARGESEVLKPKIVRRQERSENSSVSSEA